MIFLTCYNIHILFIMYDIKHMTSMYFLSIECKELDRKLSSCWCVCRVHVFRAVVVGTMHVCLYSGLIVLDWSNGVDAWG